MCLIFSSSSSLTLKKLSKTLESSIERGNNIQVDHFMYSLTLSLIIGWNFSNNLIHLNTRDVSESYKKNSHLCFYTPSHGSHKIEKIDINLFNGGLKINSLAKKLFLCKIKNSRNSKERRKEKITFELRWKCESNGNGNGQLLLCVFINTLNSFTFSKPALAK